ncbi:MAG: efflux RND transporter periplasmic adaptor subunit [Flavobacteriales bacterium]
MKKIFILPILIAGIISCSNNESPNTQKQVSTENHDGHDHGAEENHKNETKESHEGHDHGSEKNHENEAKESHEGHDHDSEENHENETKESHDGHDHGSDENHNENEVSLTQDQFELSGIKSTKIEQRNISKSVNVSGQISVPPLGFASVYAPLGGFIRKGDLLPGDFVNKGQVLAIIEHPDYIKIQEKFLQIKAKKAFYDAEVKRQNELQESELSSIKSFQESVLNKELIDAQYSSLKEQLKIIGISPNWISSNGIQKRISIKSPISGYVTENNIHLGKYVNETDQLYGIVNKADMHAELKVYTADLGNMTIGMPFEFQIAGSNKSYKGEIALIGETVDVETKTIDIHGEIKSESASLKPGMFINAQIFPEQKMAYVVPNTAIFEKENKTYIFKQVSELKYEMLEINLGITNDKFSEIKFIENKKFNIKIATEGLYQLESAQLKESGGLGHGHAH